MDRTKEYFDLWMKSQESVVDNMTDLTRKIQQAVLGLGGNGRELSGLGEIQNAYLSWMTAILDALRSAGTMDENLIRETLSKILTGSQAYLKLYEIWGPLFKALLEKNISPDAYRDLIDAKQFKEMIDRLFGFDPQAMSQVTEQIAKLLETYTAASQDFLKPWLEATDKGFTAFPEFLQGHPEALMKVFHTVYRAFDSTMGRVFHVPAVGKDREKVELLLRSLDDLSVYLAKNTQYQHAMYQTGLTSLEQVIAAVADKINKGEELKGFDEFFDLWTAVSEKTYYELFQTEQFSKTQGELLETALNVRKNFFKLSELYLEDFPVALRSEMDDLYRTIYDLKKKVKALENRLGEVQA